MRHQIDLIDMRSVPSFCRRRNKTFRWILHIKDHGGRISKLIPLEAKLSVLVAWELVEFFYEYGPPSILQSDNGTEFTAKQLVQKVQELFQGLRLVRGRPRRPQTQGLVERSNREVKRLLRKILLARGLKPCEWAEGHVLAQVMFEINSVINLTTKSSPANLTFGRRFRTQLWDGVASMVPPSTVLAEETLNEKSRELIGLEVGGPADLTDEPEEEEEEEDQEEEKNFFGSLAGVEPAWDSQEEVNAVAGAASPPPPPTEPPAAKKRRTTRAKQG